MPIEQVANFAKSWMGPAPAKPDSWPYQPRGIAAVEQHMGGINRMVPPAVSDQNRSFLQRKKDASAPLEIDARQYISPRRAYPPNRERFQAAWHESGASSLRCTALPKSLPSCASRAANRSVASSRQHGVRTLFFKRPRARVCGRDGYDLTGRDEHNQTSLSARHIEVSCHLSAIVVKRFGCFFLYAEEQPHRDYKLLK